MSPRAINCDTTGLVWYTSVSNAGRRSTADVVSGDGTINVVRYGQILQARGLVGVRGAGLGFDGLYYVDTVKHQIKLGEYKQSFTLKRNALISNVPVVPTMAF